MRDLEQFWRHLEKEQKTQASVEGNGHVPVRTAQAAAEAAAACGEVRASEI